VKKLAEALERNEIDVWVDYKDILVGQDFIKRMQKGISESNFIVTILTPNFIKGPWANAELEMAIEKEVSEGRVNILPILRIDCEIPRFLKTKNRVDFRGHRFDSGLKHLLHAISKLPQ
jgi:hypothetical protein